MSLLPSGDSLELSLWKRPEACPGVQVLYGCPFKRTRSPLGKVKTVPPMDLEFSSAHMHSSSQLPKSLPQTFSNSSGLIWAPDCSFELEPDEAIVGFADTTAGLSADASSGHLAGLCRPLGL